MFRHWKHVGIGVVSSLSTTLFLLSTFSRAPSFVQNAVLDTSSTCKTASVFRCEHCIPKPLPTSEIDNVRPPPDENWSFDTTRDGHNYGLTDRQCDVAFPGLFDEVGSFVRSRRFNHITETEFSRTQWPEASYRLMVYDNELYVLDYPKPQIHDARHDATLHALHRAIITSPTELPNTEFALTVNDLSDDKGLIWSYTRTANDNDTWLMPDFGFWSSGGTGSKASLGSWSQVRRWMREVENQTGSFSDKIQKAFWRGDVSKASTIRTDLLSNARDKSWADIEHVEIDEGNGFDEHVLPLHEHCKYMFLVHTEGNTYSGRLKYLQNCQSVIFAHTLQWIQPFHYLMVPSGPNQNYVEVKRDFSDFSEKVEYYLEHLDEAERIANNSIAIFRDRYHTPAAEACYWRKLITGWRLVSFEPDFYSEDASQTGMHWRGTPFENYALRMRRDFLEEQKGLR